ncbi:MAG: anthranilate phosphoribosyltransferase [Actinobacteria bacterium]|nr:anthranilate phosphoribosyltransferase [Actinomycetota bacterium]
MNWARVHAILEVGLDLDSEQAKWAMTQILEGSSDPQEVKKFLVELTQKGETAQEVGAFVDAMYEHCAPITIKERAVDTVGTGGDGAHTINISTTAAIIAAAAGARVIKHGNRAASSKSGSADLLESLGINISLDGLAVAQTVAQLGIGFCFAQKFHPAMRFAAPIRKEMGVPTVFNILGPLANPAQPKAAAIGVANDRMHLLMAEVLSHRGVDGFVFRGDDGLDEITLATSTSVLIIGGGEITSERVDPLDFNISHAPVEDLVGGDAAVNARITNAIFSGERGAPRDAVVLNAAAAIAAFEGNLEQDIHTRISAGIARAEEAIDSGAASELVKQWSILSNSLASS